jgi:hypothetical protein
MDIIAFAKSLFFSTLPSNCSWWSFWGSEATAESQENRDAALR